MHFVILKLKVFFDTNYGDEIQHLLQILVQFWAGMMCSPLVTAPVTANVENAKDDC